MYEKEFEELKLKPHIPPRDLEKKNRDEREEKDADTADVLPAKRAVTVAPENPAPAQAEAKPDYRGQFMKLFSEYGGRLSFDNITRKLPDLDPIRLRASLNVARKRGIVKKETENGVDFYGAKRTLRENILAQSPVFGKIKAALLTDGNEPKSLDELVELIPGMPRKQLRDNLKNMYHKGSLIRKAYDNAFRYSLPESTPEPANMEEAKQIIPKFLDMKEVGPPATTKTDTEGNTLALAIEAAHAPMKPAAPECKDPLGNLTLLRAIAAWPSINPNISVALEDMAAYFEEVFRMNQSSDD